MRFVPPVPQAELPDWYRAADVTVVPSYSESFGLVAIESQACGTPVVAASVGGLRTAVADGVVRRADRRATTPRRTPTCSADLAGDPGHRAALGRGALRHAGRFGWAATAAGMLEVYSERAARARGARRPLAVGR